MTPRRLRAGDVPLWRRVYWRHELVLEVLALFVVAVVVVAFLSAVN